MQEEYDAIIVGAGPAGLLLGKELSKKFRILIIEKNKLGVSDKSWITYTDRWSHEKFPQKFITNKIATWSMQTRHNGKIEEFTIEDDFITIEEHGFLKYLGRINKKQGAVILENTVFKKFKRADGRLVVNNKFRTKILIDCTGNSSIIMRKYKLKEIKININCYSYYAKFSEDVKNHIFYCSYKKAGEKSYSTYGFTKTGEKKAFLLYDKYSEKKPDWKLYERLMNDANKTFGIKKHKITELKAAYYPSGIIEKRSLDNILLFGDSAFYAPCINGMGFNEILRQYRVISRHITSCIEKNTFSEKDLALPNDVADEINNLYLLMFGIVLNDIPSDMLQKMYIIMKKAPKQMVRNFVRNDITDREILYFFGKLFTEIDISKFISSIKKTHLKVLIKVFIALGSDIITEEFHNLVFKHHKIRIKDMYTK